MKAVFFGIAASAILAGCGGVSNIKPETEKVASVRLEGVVPLVVVSAGGNAAGKIAPVTHQAQPKEVQGEAHHRVPASIANDPPPEPIPEHPPFDPGKTPVKPRSFFPFKLRRKKPRN